MADNLTIGIGVDTGKLRADMAVVKNQLEAATKQMEAYRKEAAKTGDTSKLKEQARVVDQINRQYVTGTAVLRNYNRELGVQAVAAAGAARGLRAVAVAHVEMGEASKVNVREITKVSKELGGLETSGFAVAKMFKEFPKVAVPVAVAAGIGEAAKKLAEAAYTNITALDDLSKATGFTSREIASLQHVFESADVPATTLNKTIMSVAESFDKAKVKAGDYGSMLSGVQTMRGAAGTSGMGIPVLRGGAAPVSGFEAQGRVFVGRGGAALNIDPSKGFGALVDQNQFRTVQEFLAAAIPPLLRINERSPSLAREIVRGQGLDPVETLRGLTATNAEEYRKALAATISDPRFQAGALPLARQFGATTREAGARGERAETTAGIPAMEAAVPIVQGLGSAAEKLSDALKHARENAAALNEALTKGVDQGELGAATESFSTAWTGTFNNIAKSWQSTVDYINSHQPLMPGGQAGQTIPIAPAAPAPATPYATGGIVGGVGSGDTVPAWLTPGEFVNRRASVAYYGPNVFSALNSRMIPRDLFSRFGFAVGGLVGDSAAHFADGGIVGSAGGGGTPIHLHLDGQSFAATMQENVATALVGAARRHQMRSTGVKPSWYGGRPGA